MHPPIARRAFTIPEVLAVVAIAIIMLALLMPALNKSKRSANIALCGNNMKNIHQGFKNAETDRKMGSGKETRAFGWQGRLLPYMQHQSKIFICPEDDEIGTGGGDRGMGDIYLAVYNSYPNGYLYNMEFVVGPFTRRIDKTTPDAEIESTWYRNAGQMKGYRDSLPENGYILGFEDLRPDGGDLDFEDVIFQVEEKPEGVEITFLYDGAGYKFDLVSRTEGVVWKELDNSGQTTPGTSAIVDTAPASYGMNVSIGQIVKYQSGGHIFMLDYERSTADGGAGQIDPWSDWAKEDRPGVPKFARHYDRANVFFYDGHMETLDPALFDPKFAEYRRDYWIPEPR